MDGIIRDLMSETFGQFADVCHMFRQSVYGCFRGPCANCIGIAIHMESVVRMHMQFKHMISI